MVMLKGGLGDGAANGVAPVVDEGAGGEKFASDDVANGVGEVADVAGPGWERGGQSRTEPAWEEDFRAGGCEGGGEDGFVARCGIEGVDLRGGCEA